MGQKACSEYLNSFVEIACAEVQEDWCFHCARVVQDQDTHQGCHQSLHQTGLRQGDEGGCEACEENLQSLPCGCSQEADLNGLTRSKIENVAEAKNVGYFVQIHSTDIHFTLDVAECAGGSNPTGRSRACSNALCVGLWIA